MPPEEQTAGTTEQPAVEVSDTAATNTGGTVDAAAMKGASEPDQPTSENLVEAHITAYVTIGGTLYPPGSTAMVTPATKRGLSAAGYARRD